jgi:hypothetical protein
MTTLSKVVLGAAALVQGQQVLVKEDPAQDQCIALVLGGGGSASAYEAGYLWALLNDDTPEQVATGKYVYDAVTGVSGGGINALAIAAWPKGEEKELVDWLSTTWAALHTKEVFTLWPGLDPIGHGIFDETGVVDDAPLLVKLAAILKDIGDAHGHGFQRKINIDAMDAISGSLIPFTEADVPYDDFAKVAVASASLPGLFPARKFGDWLFIDGGVVWGADLARGVERCREVVSDDSKIIVDMLITHSSSKAVLEKRSDNALANYYRAKNIKDWENGVAGLRKFVDDFPEITYRHFAIPSKPIGPGPTRLDFEGSFTTPMAVLGRADGKRDLGKAEGQNWKRFAEWSDLPAEEKKKVSLADYIHQM